MTILCAGRDPVDVPLKGDGRLSMELSCKGYNRTVLSQPLRAVNANTSLAKEHGLAQILLHNKCCEKLGTRFNMSKFNLNFNFRQTVSHADDLRYAGIKVRELQKHVLEHEWREKHSVIHHVYSIFLYILIVPVCLYIVVRLMLCLRAWGTCRRVAGALKFHSTPEAASGNVVNINIKTAMRALRSPLKTRPCATCQPLATGILNRRHELLAASDPNVPIFKLERFKM